MRQELTPECNVVFLVLGVLLSSASPEVEFGYVRISCGCYLCGCVSHLRWSYVRRPCCALLEDYVFWRSSASDTLANVALKRNGVHACLPIAHCQHMCEIINTLW